MGWLVFLDRLIRHSQLARTLHAAKESRASFALSPIGTSTSPLVVRYTVCSSAPHACLLIPQAHHRCKDKSRAQRTCPTDRDQRRRIFKAMHEDRRWMSRNLPCDLLPVRDRRSQWIRQARAHERYLTRVPARPKVFSMWRLAEEAVRILRLLVYAKGYVVST